MHAQLRAFSPDEQGRRPLSRGKGDRAHRSGYNTFRSGEGGPAVRFNVEGARRTSGSSYRIGLRGMEKLNADPRPGALSTQIRPPWASTIARARYNPRPVPGV